MNWVVKALSGRTSRKAYLLYWLLPSTLVLLALDLTPATGWLDLTLSVLAIAAHIVYLPLDLVFGIRRFHDTGLSGWWSVLFGFALYYRVPILILTLIAMQSFPLIYGESGAGNKWGWIAFMALLAVGVATLSWATYRLCIRSGDAGSNRFGADPLAPIATSSLADARLNPTS